MPEVNQASPVRRALGRNKAKVTEIVSDSDTRDALYKRVFSDRDGKAVLADLAKRFYDNEIKDGDTVLRDIGRRDVVRFIKLRVTPK